MSASPPPPRDVAPPRPIKKMIKRKPARKQVEQGQVEKKQPEQTGQTYNSWYHKWVTFHSSLSPSLSVLIKVNGYIGWRRQI